jgi:hypothetical protein
VKLKILAYIGAGLALAACAPRTHATYLFSSSVCSASSASEHLLANVGVSSHLQYFGYYADVMTETAGVENFAMNLGIDHYDSNGVLAPALDQAEALGLKYIYLMWFPNNFIGSAWVPPAPTDWAAFVKVMQPRLSHIQAFNLADEPGCFPRPASDSGCIQYTKNLEAQITFIKNSFPGIPIWINYIGNAFNELQGGDFTQVANLPGFKLIDWISFDAYDAPMTSVTTFVNLAKMYKQPNQKILLVPQGFASATYDENALISLADQYYQYALSEPEIIGLLPYEYNGSGNGISNMPGLKAKMTQIGEAITGKNGTPSYVYPPPNYVKLSAGAVAVNMKGTISNGAYGVGLPRGWAAFRNHVFVPSATSVISTDEQFATPDVAKALEAAAGTAAVTTTAPAVASGGCAAP